MPSDPVLNALFLPAFEASLAAGKAILEVYQMADQQVSLKEDRSPLTLADHRADDIIKKTLEPTGIPVFTEESAGVPYEIRKTWKRYWLVDPLDGTKEFIRHNHEFTVNIALIENRHPVFGIIYIPVYKQLYYAMKGHGAYRIDELTAEDLSAGDPEFFIARAKRLPDRSHEKTRLAVSRSHMSPETEAFIREKLGDQPYELVSAGSSLKFCRIAEGEADLYPRLGPTMEWDIAAGMVIVTEAGGKVLQYDGKPLLFNRQNLSNPWFIVMSGKMAKRINL